MYAAPHSFNGGEVGDLALLPPGTIMTTLQVRCSMINAWMERTVTPRVHAAKIITVEDIEAAKKSVHNSMQGLYGL